MKYIAARTHWHVQGAKVSPMLNDREIDDSRYVSILPSGEWERTDLVNALKFYIELLEAASSVRTEEDGA